MGKNHLHYALILLFFSFSTAQSQDFLVKGKIVDAATGAPIEAATIYAETLKDSTLITYTITNAEGIFALEGKTAYKKARLAFSSNGFTPQAREVTLEPVMEIGTMKSIITETMTTIGKNGTTLATLHTTTTKE